MPNDRPPPPPFVDRTLDYTFPRDGDSYRILWDEDGLFPVDLDAMPVALGLKRQFFIDDYLIAAAHNIGRTVHQPRKHEANPLVLPDRPWEGRPRQHCRAGLARPRQRPVAHVVPHPPGPLSPGRRPHGQRGPALRHFGRRH